LETTKAAFRYPLYVESVPQLFYFLLSVALQQSKKLLGKRKKHANGYWQERARRRDFFCRLAEELNFDPLQPANWANVKKFELLTRKVTLHAPCALPVNE